MATAYATTPSTITVVGSSIIKRSNKKSGNVKFIKGLNSFNGLKAENSVTSLGVTFSTEQAFAKVMCSLKYPSFKGGNKGKSGGAFSSTCNAAGEIFQIAAILNGLTLVGVAVGFVLLRIEAFVEEAE